MYRRISNLSISAIIITGKSNARPVLLCRTPRRRRSSHAALQDPLFLYQQKITCADHPRFVVGAEVHFEQIERWTGNQFDDPARSVAGSDHELLRARVFKGTFKGEPY